VRARGGSTHCEAGAALDIRRRVLERVHSRGEPCWRRHERRRARKACTAQPPRSALRQLRSCGAPKERRARTVAHGAAPGTVIAKGAVRQRVAGRCEALALLPQPRRQLICAAQSHSYSLSQLAALLLSSLVPLLSFPARRLALARVVRASRERHRDGDLCCAGMSWPQEYCAHFPVSVGGVFGAPRLSDAGTPHSGGGQVGMR